MGLGATLAGAATSGLAGAVTGGIGSIVSGGLGLLGGLFKKNNNGFKNQQKLMQQAWEYEKEGMGLQYNYGQQAADAEYKRNLQMWKDTNFGAQRAEMEDAGLSVGLMYGNGGGQAASTAGGDGMQPSGPKMNPVEAALQQQSLGLQLKQIEAQNRLANAEATKTIAEANKIAGVDTKGKDLENKWQEIENRIQLSKENIAAANVTEANANAQKAVELWNQEMLNTKYLDETQEERRRDGAQPGVGIAHNRQQRGEEQGDNRRRITDTNHHHCQRQNGQRRQGITDVKDLHHVFSDTAC